MIEISLAENLSGDLCLLELELANKNLQFKSAQLVAKLRLDQVSVFNPIHIVRYLMHDWFWTCGTIAVIML